jgi:uncharacterized membrane protein
MQRERQFWFPAKHHGWGWGLPSAWQGWLVLVVFALLLIAGALGILPGYGQVAFCAYAALLVGLLMVICWLTGEPPRWRRGGK